MFRMLLISIIWSSLWAQATVTPLEKKSSQNADIELQSMVIDETMTKIGKDFYDLFFMKWVSPIKDGQYQITISERILPRIGSQITVKVNDLISYQSFVKPRYEEIENAVAFAIQQAQQVVINYENIKKTLESEEMKGTGIY